MDKINDLIEQLSGDTAIVRGSLRQRYLYVVSAATFVIAVAGLWVFHIAGSSVRPEYLQVIQDPVVAAKQGVPLIIALVALPLSMMLLRPEARLSLNAIPLVAALLVLPTLMIFSLTPMSDEARNLAVSGGGVIKCLLSILALSILLIAAQLVVLRQGAVTKPVSAGCIAGLAAGAIGAVIYAFICTEDHPGFFGLWYTLGILLAGTAGALAGKLALRW